MGKKTKAKISGTRPAEDVSSPQELLRIEKLLRSRGDLARGDIRSMEHLSNLAMGRDSLFHCFFHLTRFEVQILELLMAAGPQSSAQLAELLGVEKDVLRPALDRLDDRWLIKKGGIGWKAANLGNLGIKNPAGLGRPLETLARSVTIVELNAALTVHGLPVAKSKNAAVAKLVSVIGEVDYMVELFRNAPADAKEMLRALADGPPSVITRYNMRISDHPELSWLMSRALLLQVSWNEYQLPREAGIALRGGRFVRNPASIPPDLQLHDAAESHPGTTSWIAGLVSQVGHLCSVVEADPLTPLVNGGLGVKEVRRLATALDVDVRRAAILTELVSAAGLVDSTWIEVESTKKAYQRPKEMVGISGRTEDFAKMTLGQRWVHLVRAWLSSPVHLSASGTRDENDRIINTLSGFSGNGLVPCQRFAALTALKDVFPAGTAGGADLHEYLSWSNYQLFARFPSAQVTEELLAEADMLGVVANGAITQAGLHVLNGLFDEAAALIDATTSQLAERFTVQPDATVIVAGTPEPQMLERLLQFADVESRDAAWILRVSESSLRRGFDVGLKAEEVQEFLAGKAERDVPQAVIYLVDDVARRHGNVVVGAATSFVQTVDSAVLADIIRAKSLKKMNLRKIAPTVAISNAPAERLLNELRKASFLPKLDSGVVTVGVGRDERPEGEVTFEDAPFNHVDLFDANTLAREILNKKETSRRAASESLEDFMGQLATEFNLGEIDLDD